MSVGPIRRFSTAALSAALAPVVLSAIARCGQQTPVLKVTTRLIQVHVTARDSHGQPVADLERGDFTLLDEGRPQPITFFAAERAQTPDSTTLPPLPPNTFSNRLEKLAGATSVTAILFDGLNTPMTDQAYARRQIVRFLEELPPNQKVALYALGRGLVVLQDFTSDSHALIEALKTYQGELSPEKETAVDRAAPPEVVRFHGWLEELKLNLIEHYKRDRALRTIRSLVAIANHLERVPGRKNLIWVSGSFPVWISRDSVPLPNKPQPGPQRFRPEVERAARALNNANLAVYPVDARGLMAPAEYSPERSSISRDSKLSDWSGFQTMEILADRTGGAAFFNTNDLTRALHEALEDSRITYVLGYAPSHDSWDGRFREIKVRVNRPGVRLRYRHGYFAQPEEPSEEWYRSAVLGAAMWSPVDATGLGLTVRVAPRSKRSWDLELSLDPRNVSLLPGQGFWTGKLDVWLVQLGRADKLLDAVSHIADLRLNDPVFASVMRANKLVLMERLELKRRTELVRVLVRDVGSGTLGSVSIPVDRVRTGDGSD